MLPRLEEIHNLDKCFGEELVNDKAGMVRISPETARPIATNTGGVRGAIGRRVIEHCFESGCGIEKLGRHTAM